jgi:hypothetical protein
VPAVTSSESATPEPQGKGRPTPKRSEKVRRRSGPVAPPPRTRKEAAQRKKQEMKAARGTARAGARAGDDRYMVKRDAGPVRRLVRDIVDGRRSAGVLVLPVAVALVLSSLTRVEVVQAVITTLWLATLLMVLIDVVVLTITIRRRVRAEFPDERRLGGHVAYGLLRSTVFRRWRMPPAAVSP